MQAVKDERALAGLLEDGEPVPLSKGKSAIVMPIGVVHLDEMQDAISALVDAIPADVFLGSDTTASLTLIDRLVPVVKDKLLGLVAACTVVQPQERTFASLPHYDAAAIGQKWLEINFAPERMAPWVAMVKGVLHRLEAKGLSLSGMLSKRSSRAATASPTSSTTASPASPIAAGP
jgi:hypothetical protein